MAMHKPQVFVSKPFLHVTRDQAQFSRIVGKSSHLGTAQAHFNGTTPQRHGENRLMFHPQAGLCHRLRYIEFNLILASLLAAFDACR
jgi:hypothetical protein